jgi:hypothetical protein
MPKAKKIPDDCMPICKSCCFFVPHKNSSYGDCRRYPPMIMEEDSGCTFSFSVSAIDDWCGEYQRRVN